MKKEPPPSDRLSSAVIQILRNPLRSLVPPWSWKAASCTAVTRALAFFATNLQAGRLEATKAMLVEALFSVLVGGLIGAISQQLRKAKPLWATALLICVGLPATFIIAQLGIHHIAKTQHQSSGIVASALLGGLAAAYSWYAMRHGAMLGGTDETTIRHDMQALPRITAGFLLVLPRALIAGYRQLRGPDR